MTCTFRDLVRKWYHNPDDSTDIIFRLILSSSPQFNIKLCNSSCAMTFIFCYPVSKPDDLSALFKFGFVGVHWYSSSQHLIELSPILSITVGQIVKTKFRVNLKYHKIIVIFYVAH